MSTDQRIVVNGTFSCENDKSLNGYLKTEFGFQGCKYTYQGGQADSMLNAMVTDIMSDWWATHSGAPAVNAGLDASALAVAFL